MKENKDIRNENNADIEKMRGSRYYIKNIKEDEMMVYLLKRGQERSLVVTRQTYISKLLPCVLVHRWSGRIFLGPAGKRYSML